MKLRGTLATLCIMCTPAAAVCGTLMTGDVPDYGSARAVQGSMMALTECLAGTEMKLTGAVPSKCLNQWWDVLTPLLEIGRCEDDIFRKHQMTTLALPYFDYPNLALNLFRVELAEDLLVRSGYQTEFRASCLPSK
jgi:hypothetical protein